MADYIQTVVKSEILIRHVGLSVGYYMIHTLEDDTKIMVDMDSNHATREITDKEYDRQKRLGY